MNPARAIHPFWEGFRRRLDSVVHECNCMAGERIWSISTGEDYRLEISGEFPQSPRMELTLDPGSGRLWCRFRSALRESPWVFQVLPDGTGLRRRSRTYRIADAVDEVLDHLADAASARE